MVVAAKFHSSSAAPLRSCLLAILGTMYFVQKPAVGSIASDDSREMADFSKLAKVRQPVFGLAATAAADYIASLYSHQLCSVKIILSSSDVTSTSNEQDFAQVLAAELEQRNMEPEREAMTSVATFAVSSNLTYKSPVLDAFLQWGTRCVVNVVSCLSARRDEYDFVIDFAAMLSSRDRTSFVLAVHDGGEDESDKLFKRFRNLHSACLLSVRDLDVVCVEDHERAPSRGVDEQQLGRGGRARRTLSGKRLNAYAYQSLPTAAWFISNQTGRLVFAEGLDYTMLLNLAKVHNFTFTLNDAPNGNWGQLTPGAKSFDGMIGAVSGATGDIGIGEFFQVIPRAYGVSYCLYGRDGTTFIVPLGKEVPNWKSVLSIFNIHTWLLFLSSGGFLFLAWRATCMFVPKLHVRKPSEKLVWLDIFAQGLAAMMRRVDFSEEPAFLRILINAWIIIGFFFAGILFKCVLTQKLTTVQYEFPINTAEELVERRIPVQYSELYNLVDDVYPHYSLGKVLDKGITTDYKQGMRLIAKEGRFSMLSSIHDALYLQKTEFWDARNSKPLFHVASASYLVANTGWVLQKHAYFEDTVSQALTRFVEAGLIIKWEKDLVQRKRAGKNSDNGMEVNSAGRDPSQRVLGMKELGWVFKILLYGMIAASAVFFCEIFYSICLLDVDFPQKFACEVVWFKRKKCFGEVATSMQ